MSERSLELDSQYRLDCDKTEKDKILELDVDTLIQSRTQLESSDEKSDKSRKSTGRPSKPVFPSKSQSKAKGRTKQLSYGFSSDDDDDNDE